MALLLGAVVLALGIGVVVAAIVFVVMLGALLPETDGLEALILSGLWAVGAGIVSALIAIPVSAVGIGMLRRR